MCEVRVYNIGPESKDKRGKWGKEQRQLRKDVMRACKVPEKPKSRRLI